MKIDLTFPPVPLRKPQLITTLFVNLILGGALVTGCHTSTGEKKPNDFFTSGSREADQRASQKMAQAEQLDGKGKEGRKKVEGGGNNNEGGSNGAVRAEEKLALYARLGNEVGISNIVADFLPRALNDPRVNWTREGVSRSGFLKSHEAETWKPTPDNVANLKLHIIQFLTLATGGPTEYQGGTIKTTHKDLQITNAEFDAAIGDLKATLDRLQIANREQKELLAIVESTRPQIVTQR